jgi:antitoxin component YwqK of YwqJK toxin-antitoxin module
MYVYTKSNILLVVLYIGSQVAFSSSVFAVESRPVENSLNLILLMKQCPEEIDKAEVSSFLERANDMLHKSQNIGNLDLLNHHSCVAMPWGMFGDGVQKETKKGSEQTMLSYRYLKSTKSPINKAENLWLNQASIQKFEEIYGLLVEDGKYVRWPLAGMGFSIIDQGNLFQYYEQHGLWSKNPCISTSLFDPTRFAGLKYDNDKIGASYEWDKEGNVIKSEIRQKVSTAKIDVKAFVEEWYNRDEAKFRYDANMFLAISPLVVHQMPKDQLIKRFFERQNNYIEALRNDHVNPMAIHPYIDVSDKIDLEYEFDKNHLLHVSCKQECWQTNAWITWGYVFEFGPDKQITRYFEGSLSRRSTLNRNPFYHEGIELIYHGKGVPASYKTIVRNRLFGRQIEWNEKGEVISDVDLDIPQPWPDAPKKTEEAKEN